MGIAYNPSVVNDGLVLLLDAGNTKSYPGSGTTWYDRSGKGNDFTLSGVTYNSSTGSFTFADNDGDYVARSTSDVIGGLTDITVEMWIKISTLQTQIPFISYNTSLSDNAFLVLKDSANALRAYFGTNSAAVTFANTNWNVGNYINFSIARSGSNIKYYINGTFIVETNSYPTGSIPTGGTLLFGQEQDSPGGGFNTIQDFPGDYAKIAIYNRQLSASEVTQNYNALKGRFATPSIVTSGLVLNLDAGDSSSYPGSGTTWTDLSGNNNNVTLTNGPTYSSANAGSIVFDGSDDYADFFAPNLGTTTTVEMWVKLGASYSNKMFFGWLRYDVWCGNGNLGYNTANSDVYGISSATVSSLGLVNNWKHYVFEMRTDVSYTNNKIYIDGSLQTLSQRQGSENASNRSFNSGNGRISGWRTSTAYPIPMENAVFRVYNRALSASEIQQNFDALKGRYGL